MPPHPIPDPERSTKTLRHGLPDIDERLQTAGAPLFKGQLVPALQTAGAQRNYFRDWGPGSFSAELGDGAQWLLHWGPPPSDRDPRFLAALSKQKQTSPHASCLPGRCGSERHFPESLLKEEDG